MADHDALTRIEEKLDKLMTDFAEYRVGIEHRLTVVEVRSSILGALAGAIGGALSVFLGHKF